jgi:hypothetical protein
MTKAAEGEMSELHSPQLGKLDHQEQADTCVGTRDPRGPTRLKRKRDAAGGETPEPLQGYPVGRR